MVIISSELLYWIRRAGSKVQLSRYSNYATGWTTQKQWFDSKKK